MICVSLGRTRHKMMIAEHKALADRGAQLVELRLDWLSHLPDLGRMLAGRPTPVVITCRRARDKGLWKWTEEQRLMVLRSAIVSGAEYVDLEEDIAGSIRRYGTTKRIVSFHDFEQTPENLDEIHAKMLQHDPDIVKLVTMANSPLDNVRILKLAASSKVPTIGFCMGEFGIPSRILAGRYGAPFTYATFSQERTMAPGQLTFDEMRDVFHYDKIDAATEIYGVVADPVAHSLSPVVHNAAFARDTLNKVYLPFRVPKDALAATINAFEWLPVQGYSVTLPHKEALLEITQQYEGPVREIGAANTLFRGTDGGWKAANTDCDAALKSLVRELAPDLAAGTDASLSALAGRKVLILGAGGVARAIARGVVSNGGVLMIANRTKARAAELVEQLGCLLVEWQNRGAVFADVLINCTSVGMHPKLDETPFAENWLREGMIVFDTIYNPERTLLIKHARERGARTVTGVDMFVGQAARQFELFTGRSAPDDVMREALRKAISRRQDELMVITLIGYRGSGKTTVAQSLAARLGWNWIDADAVIEAAAGSTIKEIFAAEGESGFRARERQALAESLTRDKLVLAAGGGAILNRDTRRDMQAAGPVVWLQASVARLAERIEADPTTAGRRPNLAGGGIDEIRRLLSEREPLYRECASLSIDTDALSVDEIAERIAIAVQSALIKEGGSA